ncbi:ATP-binding protein [Paenibacillus macerans]|uniref:ATP-binding protein n=1 Tax=Paenibacillus macerans TaxID=44252 RepID=A0A6N8F268_PAEMA|nr:ATP-binding protein [Paenibacillus macerans]MUG26019.1 ATP-binding protein [Paenibacillus macerans]
MKEKGFDLEEIQNRVNLLSSTSRTEPAQAKTYRCSKCKDEEFLLIRTGDGREYAVDCDCRKERASERLLKSSKITAEFQNKTFGNFVRNGRPKVVLEAYEAAWNYVQDLDDRNTPNKSIALLGRPGCGKTHLLMAISNSLLAKSVQVLYFPFVEGFNEIRSNLDTLEQRIYQLQQAQVLYIDDLFKGRKEITDFVIEQTFAVVNYRYLEKKPILISSEKTIAGLCEIDEGIGSRINEMCRDYRVVLTGGIELNYRLR